MTHGALGEPHQPLIRTPRRKSQEKIETGIAITSMKPIVVIYRLSAQ